MSVEQYLRDIVQQSLSSTPEDMLETSLNACIQLAGANGGSILGDEGPFLRFLFSDVAALIGTSVPVDSIAGETVNRSLVVYTYAPMDKRHFSGVDRQTHHQTRYLLSIPIPSILASAGEARLARNAGALQLLFDENVAPGEVGDADLPHEFGLAAFRESRLHDEVLKGVLSILPIIAFGMEVMALRQTSYQAIHELKNKLISGLSWLNCLKEDIVNAGVDVDGDADLAEDFELAGSSIREGAELAKKYLQLTRLYTPEFADADVRTVVEETAASARALALDLGSPDLVVSVEAGESAIVRQVDTAQLKMALFNLCKNAVEALVQDGVEQPSLGLWVRPDGDRVEVGIRDNGRGMPKEIADNLFVPFKTKKEGGTGLGLTITKKIVDIHGGTIRCTTGSDGTAFTVTL